MFDIGWSELVVIGVVALIVIGPKELPGVLRMAGQWIGKVRRMASDFQGQFQEAMREAEMSDLKKEVDELADSTRDLTSGFDPIGSTFDDPFDDKSKDVVTPPADAGETPPVPASVSAPETADPSAGGEPPVAGDDTADSTPATPKAAAGGPST